MKEKLSGWAMGWTAFAGIMMVMTGVWWIFSGIAAIFNNNLYVVTQEWIFKFDVTTWGWIHMILGIVILLAGLGLFFGAVWARVIGVIVAVLAGLAAFAWLPWYPIWAIIFITISVAIIWALTAHGSDITEA